jgi:5-methylcytosine-specific restriction enzyme A
MEMGCLKNKLPECLKIYLPKTCKLLNKITSADEVHHIKNLAKHWDLRLEYDNLIPLCVECHDNVHREELEPIERTKKFIASP